MLNRRLFIEFGVFAGVMCVYYFLKGYAVADTAALTDPNTLLTIAVVATQRTAAGLVSWFVAKRLVEDA